MANLQKNPFVGLRPFEHEDNLYFFGRNEQTKALLKLLHEAHFLTVVGSSGCGKSSLVRAGLIPHLEAGFLVQDRDVWHIARMKPGDQPMTNLAQALLTALKQEAAPAKVTEFAASLQEQGVHAAMDQIVPVLTATDSNLLLLVDQFEEIFRFSMNLQAPEKRDEAVEFVATLLRLAEQADTPIYVCLTMRSDYLGDCDQFQGLPEAMNRSQYLVPRLTRAQRREAILGPIQLAGATISPPLLDRLLNETIAERDDLPVLQHALMLTWNEWAKTGTGAIEISHYEQIGTIHHALSRHADEALNELTQRDPFLAQQLFQALTETDASNRQIRRPTHLNDLAAIAETTPEKMLAIIQQFRKDERNFLVLSSPNAAENPLVDISHESLIRQWEKLNEWVNKEAESAKIYRRLAESAELYAQGRAGLYRKADLDLALFWRVAQHPNQAWARRYHSGFAAAIDFLTKSVKAHNDEISEKEKQLKEREQFLQDKAKLMGEQNRQQRKTIRLTRLFSTVLGVAFLMALFLGYQSYQQSQKAKKQTLLANYNLAKVFEEKALHAYTLCVKDSNYLDFQKALLYTGASLRQEIPQDCTVLDASANGKLLSSDFVNNSLSEKRTPSYVKLHQGFVMSVAFSPDGPILVSGTSDGKIQLWEMTTGRKIQEWQGHTGAVFSVVFRPDGQILASGGADKSIRLWNMATRSEIRKLDGHTGEIYRVTFSPDGQILASGASDQTIRLWEMDTGREIRQLQGHKGMVISLAFSPDGQTLASGAFDKSIYLWKIATGKVIRELDAEIDYIRSLAFSPNGQKLAFNSSNNSIKLWDLTTESDIGWLLGHTSEVTCIVFSPDGQTIASGSDDQSVRLWDVAIRKEICTLMGHKGTIRSVAFSQNGQILASGSSDKTIKLWDLRPFTLFFSANKPTPLYLKFMEGVEFFLGVKLNGLNFIYKNNADSTYKLGDNNNKDAHKFFPLSNSPAPGKTKFDQILEWAMEQEKQ
jgi:WD40 repeat protein/energy-coupling factor transporter ATP-binding protein EcfA2